MIFLCDPIPRLPIAATPLTFTPKPNFLIKNDLYENTYFSCHPHSPIIHQ